MRMLFLACMASVVGGCSPMWTDEVDSLLTSEVPHSAYRIRYPSSEYGSGKMEVIVGPVEMSTEWSKRFDVAMQEVGAANPNEEYACIPNPGVMVALHDGKVHARFLLCFECNILVLEDENGNRVGSMRSFVDQRKTLGELAIEAFPNDKYLAKVVNTR
jgi:hypothetical protein